MIGREHNDRIGAPHVPEQLRRTKIIATLGPATDAPGALRHLLAEGVNVVRLNLSHGTADDHRARADAVRAAARELGVEIGVLADLQGPKIRIERFANGPVELVSGAPFALDCRADAARRQHARRRVISGSVARRETRRRAAARRRTRLA
jgi:pyruvate kinase